MMAGYCKHNLALIKTGNVHRFLQHRITLYFLLRMNVSNFKFLGETMAEDGGKHITLGRLSNTYSSEP